MIKLSEVHEDLEGDELINLDRSFDFQRRQNLTLLLPLFLNKNSDNKLKRS